MLAEQAWRVEIDKLAGRGQRVIAFASKVARGAGSLEFDDVEAGGLALIGLVGLIDPPRAEAVQAIAQCKAAGIDVKMITGDHASTAAAIARELGLGKGTVDALTGHAIDAMDEEALRRALPTTSVFTRAQAPSTSWRLVEALQADGAVGTMTGDGVNDAPALKRADVGVAMGRKHKVAKEASEMVLADDNFATIAAAVREGRMSMTIWSRWSARRCRPWRPRWHRRRGPPRRQHADDAGANLMGQHGHRRDAGAGFAFDPAEPGVLDRAPRDPRAPILSSLLAGAPRWCRRCSASWCSPVFFWALERGEEIEHAQTFAVNAMVGLEIAYLFSVRLRNAVPFDFRAIRLTRALLIGVGAVVVLQVLFTYLPPLEILYDTRPIDWPDIGVAALAAIGLISCSNSRGVRIGLFGARRA